VHNPCTEITGTPVGTFQISAITATGSVPAVDMPRPERARHRGDPQPGERRAYIDRSRDEV